MCVGGILSIGKGFYPDVAIVGAEFLKSCKHSMPGHTPPSLIELMVTTRVLGL